VTTTAPNPDAAPGLEALVPGWLTLPEVAERMGTTVPRVRQLLAERALVAVRHGGVLAVPASLLDGDHPVKALQGLLTVLGDGGYSDVEAVRWLFTADDSLPGTPAQALAENRGGEVKRRAQALAF
jgi:hypothetical protein